MSLALIALLAAFAQDPAPQVAPAAPSQPVSTPAEDEEEQARLNEIICRREHVVGSNRPQRVCQTRRQWEHESRRSQLNGEPERGEGRTEPELAMASSIR